MIEFVGIKRDLHKSFLPFSAKALVPDVGFGKALTQALVIKFRSSFGI